jgi:hypothetical protein
MRTAFLAILLVIMAAAAASQSPRPAFSSYPQLIGGCRTFKLSFAVTGHNFRAAATQTTD